MLQRGAAWYRAFPIGLRHMMVAAFAFSIMSLLVKLVGQRLPSAELVLGRSVVALAMSYVMVRRARASLWGERRALLVFRGLMGFGALLCYFYAIPRLPLAEATVLQFTHPIFTALLAALVLREPLRPAVLGSVALSLCGVALIARPGFLFGAGAEALAPVPVLVMLLGAMGSSIAYVSVRNLSRTEHPMTIVFYFPLVSVPASIPIMAPVAVWPTPWEWFMLLGIGLFTQMGQVYLTKGLHAEEAARASSASYVQILFATAWGALFLGEYPDLVSVAGGGFILAGLVLVARAKR